jgi:MoaA/NifB/PqqE/SkfB family radical SAM enzyme
MFHLTGRCNLNCAYCEDYGARRANDELIELGVLSPAAAGQVLAVLRQGVANLILTGGEPLLYPHLDALAAQAKTEHSFRNLTLLTNGLLMSKHLGLLTYLDRLVISLDSLDVGRWGETIGLDSEAAQTIIETIEALVGEQKKYNFALIVNCVVTPETLTDAGAVLDFCVERNIGFAFSPQSFNNWPRYELLVDDEYRNFVEKVIDYKKRNLNILGSLAYLNLMRDFQAYHCYPTLIPRVLPNGDLIYPCRPIERSQTPHGGRPCNLLQVGSWPEAIMAAETRFGSPPISCLSCFQQCYAEPSLMQARPLSLLWEMLAFSPSRKLKIHTFAPG